jgi:HEAT repeat protein
MCPRRFVPLLAVALLLAALRPAAAADADTTLSDEQTLRAAGLRTDGASLLEFFRRRTLASVEPEQLAVLVKRLGGGPDAGRDKAAEELVGLGPLAVTALRQVARDPDDQEVGARARRCLQALEGRNAAALPVAAARLLVQRKPTGAAEALLAFLPFADDDNVSEEVKAALGMVALRDGKPEPVLVRALDDPLAVRRAAAVEALSQVPGDELRPALRKLLRDPRPTVRLRAALALAGGAHDAKAVSTLITLLADVPTPQARLAEDYLLSLAAEQAPKVPLGNDDLTRQKCRDAWAAWWLGTESPAILDEFSRRTLTDALRDQALALMAKLADDAFEAREKATTELQALGPAIAPLLRQHVNDPDLEVSARIRKCLQVVDKDKVPPLSPVAPRLVALRRPPGAVEALLAFLPSAEDEAVVSEVQAALAAVAVRDGKPEPALVQALEDKQPLRRAVAAAALWQAGVADTRAAVRKLLDDPDPTVRLHVGVVLAAAGERAAVPVLIAVLAQLPPDKVLPAEEYLRHVAGESAPNVTLTADEAERRKCRDAWAAWWHDHEATADLVLATGPRRLLGYTMILSLNPTRVAEISPDGRTRWQLEGFQYAYDAQVLPGDRVLIAEYNALRVSERNLKNEVLWEKRLMFNPISAQRLPSGNTFIATNSALIEVDKTGKEVLTVQRPQGDFTAAQKLRDGQIICVTQQGSCLRLDAAGKELKSFPCGQTTMGGLDVLPNGRILIAQYSGNKVAEFDPDGKMVWQATVATPTSAVRLPNGNTLVASTMGQQVLELDRTGKTVWEFKNPGRPWKVRRR